MARTGVLSALVYLLVASLTTASPSPSSTIEILLWPLSSPSPTPLVSLAYDISGNSTNVSISDYISPTMIDDDFSRLGFFRTKTSPLANDVDEKTWSGILVPSNVLSSLNSHTIQLLYDESSREIYHVGLIQSALISCTPNPSKPCPKQSLNAELVKASPAPSPHLNKPIVLDEEGKLQGDKPPEKSFLQKYWWAIGIFLVVQVFLGSSGGEEKK